MENQALIIAYLGSNLIGALLFWTSWKKPLTGRFMYALLFLWAGQFNWRTCRSEPDIYQGYAEFAVLPFYKTFIEGWFSGQITTLVSVIAAGQILIGFSMAFGGLLTRLGALGGIIFLLAIAPLGMGSAFPATVLMALGCFSILRNGLEGSFWKKPNL